MGQLLTFDLWDTIHQLSKAKCRKYAAIAYVTDDEVVQFGKGDVLIVDASDAAIMAGQTRASLLDAAVKRKAQVFSIEGLHAKVYVLGDTVIVGSCNLSQGSQRRVEAGILSDEPSLVGDSKLFIESLRDLGSCKVVDNEFVQRVSKLPVRASNATNNTTELPKPFANSRTWLVKLTGWQEDLPKDYKIKRGAYTEAKKERTEMDSDLWHFKADDPLQPIAKAKQHDTLICIWDEGNNSAVQVYRQSFIRSVKSEKQTTLLCVEGTKKVNDSPLSLGQFQRLCTHVGWDQALPDWSCEIDGRDAKRIQDYWDDYLDQ